MLSDKLSFRDMIKNAILKKHIVEFYCKGQYIFAEPHAYGIKNGKILLMVYQLHGERTSNRLPQWRDMDVNEIQTFKLSDKHFPGERVSFLIIDKHFDTILEIVTGC